MESPKLYAVLERKSVFPSPNVSDNLCLVFAKILGGMLSLDNVLKDTNM